jgi:chromosome segregation ATPase
LQAYDTDKDVKEQIQMLQRDLMTQKRLQKEQTLKLEDQISRLASKVDILSNELDNMPGVKSNYNAQYDALWENQRLRDMLKKMNDQSVDLANRMENLSTELHKRDEQNAMLERKLKERDAQLEELRKEMQKQLDQQQLAFQEKMDEALVQMQRLAMSSQGNASLKSITSHNSLLSLEPLYPAESPQRQTQVRFVEVPTGEPNLFAPAENGTGFSMAAGIMMNNPLFSDMSKAVGKSTGKSS